MPMFVGTQRLHESGPLLGSGELSPVQPPRSLQYAIHGGWADGHHVIVEHHEGEPPVAFQRVAIVVVENRLLLPVLEPPVAWHLPIVFVGLSVAVLPVVELAGGE